jgi:hypothetical protein
MGAWDPFRFMEAWGLVRFMEAWGLVRFMEARGICGAEAVLICGHEDRPTRENGMFGRLSI